MSIDVPDVLAGIKARRVYSISTVGPLGAPHA
jgi:hypothetical protein